MAFIRMLSSVCSCAMRGRRGAAAISMASHSAAAYALMRHDEMKAAAHGQPKPLPTASFVRSIDRLTASVLRVCRARYRRPSSSATWRACSPCRSASPSSSAQPPLIYLPRGARLRKYREMRAGRGCSSGTDTHAGAPVTIAHIGNSTTADRLRTRPRASDDANTLNFTLKFHKK